MMYRSLLPRDLFAEFDRLQRDLGALFDPSPSIRGVGRGGFPALNVGSSPASVEVAAFAPGIDPATIEVQLDRGVLIIAGERRGTPPQEANPKSAQHLQERFTGRFRRVVSLPDDIDPDAVAASYRDGVLHISVKRRQASRPRRIEIH